MARCGQCNKFVSYEGGEEPEENGDFEVTHQSDTSVEVAGAVDRLLNCADCGNELKRATIEFNIEVDFQHAEGCPVLEKEDGEDDGDDDVEPEYEIETSFEASEETQTQHWDKRKKKMVPSKPRYWRQFYGVAVTGTVTCTHCKATAEFEETTNEAASAFEETGY